jgi:hypothetical protein
LRVVREKKMPLKLITRNLKIILEILFSIIILTAMQMNNATIGFSHPNRIATSLGRARSGYDGGIHAVIAIEHNDDWSSEYRIEGYSKTLNLQAEQRT